MKHAKCLQKNIWLIILLAVIIMFNVPTIAYNVLGEHVTHELDYREIDKDESDLHAVYCLTCNGKYVGAVDHVWSMNSSGSTHYQRCSLCGFTTDTVSHSSSTWIITSIRHSKECDECGATFSSGVHSYGASMSITTDTHTRFCSVCDYSKVDDHAISSWTITSASHRGTCSVCNYTVFESHSFKNGACSKCGVSESTINSMIEQGIEQMTITAPTVTE